MPYDAELTAALEAARKAGGALRDLYERFEVIPDAPASISTDADRQSQEIILDHLHRTFPEDALCAEESTQGLVGVASVGPRLWIVDPIDGTRGFARKNGEFSVMVAFVDRGKIAVGVVLEPAKERLTYAVKGGGCWRLDGVTSPVADAPGSPVACHVTTTTALGSARLTQSRSRDPNRRSRWVEALGVADVIETYSAGIKLAQVARGEADVYLNTYDAFHDWDICAGHILVEEAGGRVTGTHGEELCYGLEGAWQRQGLLASNGRLHEEALQRLKTTEK